MKNKPVFIVNIIRSILIFIFLMFIFTKNSQLLTKLMVLPFLLCTICYISENVFLLINKEKIAKIFHKLFALIFLLSALIFLIIWSYSCVREKNYLLLIFTIPFWIFWFYFVRRILFNIKPKQKNKPNKFDFRIIVSVFLVFCILISGIICLVIGINDTYKLNKITKGYLTTNGYFKDYEIYNTSHNGSNTNITYRLVYTYEVDGKQYTTKTDYGVGYIPEVNSIRKVKYNPNNPSKAILSGTNRNSGLIYFGAFFLLGGTVFVLIFLYAKGIFDKVKINVIGTYIGIVFLIVGIGIIAFQNGTTSSFKETVKSMGFWILIPIMFIVIGITQTVKCLFFERLNINKKEKNKK